MLMKFKPKTAFHREEMAEADRHLVEEMEAERQRALDMAKERANKLEDFHKDYRSEITHKNSLDMHIQGWLEAAKGGAGGSPPVGIRAIGGRKIGQGRGGQANQGRGGEEERQEEAEGANCKKTSIE